MTSPAASVEAGHRILVVANSTDTTDDRATLLLPFELNEHNQLFRNESSLFFADVSVAAGLENTKGLTAPFDGSPTITWAIVLVDVDLDGDLDIVWADDQAAVPQPPRVESTAGSCMSSSMTVVAISPIK